MNLSEMAKRQFREVARVAGLIFQGYPGAQKSARQVQASGGLFFDVFAKYDPENLLLEQSRREVLERQLELQRIEQKLDKSQNNKISEFECARRIKELKKIKDLFDKEIKGLNELISDIQDVIFMYEDIYGIENKNFDLNYTSSVGNELHEEATERSIEEQEVRPTSEALAWHKKNSWYGKEKYMKETKMAYAFHYQIVNEGINADTPEYYDELNRRIFRMYPELYVIKINDI